MDFTLDLTAVFTAIITVLSAIFTSYIIPYIKSKLIDSQESQVAFWVDIAVQAAEQIWLTSEESGEEKYAYVVDFLTSQGFEFDEVEIKALIESSVYNLKNEVLEAFEYGI